ncbi:hypothetical protein [Fimbriimonas ginsengisoli]|uniref:Lipoprotein n=1 Tax=Fimbriimonas ginsengisoli Gsoil 348 TaxID=661478 RepID=A0A068NZ29_FIMGI|nr:hypothetical protein [Fimbriimonas ginsengisoli]AIE87854.1 hypothetical protein OP10G_4486 [Fimbriimonas ginsengisoli Gsoil 348]
MRKLLSLVAVLAVFGCHKGDPTPSEATTSPATVTKAPAAGGGGGGVAPIGSGVAGGMTPMAGTDSVEGSGMGGIGQAAKDRAKRAAAGGGAPAGTTETTGETTTGE